MTNDKHLILKDLSQGQVLTGIAIACPTLVTWMYSMKNEKEEIYLRKCFENCKAL